jgi:hypothetical protein
LGYKSIRIAPKFPKNWKDAEIELCLPNEHRISIKYRYIGTDITLNVECETDLDIELNLPWYEKEQPQIISTENAKIQIQQEPEIWSISARVNKVGTLILQPQNH